MAPTYWRTDSDTGRAGKLVTAAFGTIDVGGGWLEGGSRRRHSAGRTPSFQGEPVSHMPPGPGSWRRDHPGSLTLDRREPPPRRDRLRRRHHDGPASHAGATGSKDRARARPRLAKEAIGPLFMECLCSHIRFGPRVPTGLSLPHPVTASEPKQL